MDHSKDKRLLELMEIVDEILRDGDPWMLSDVGVIAMIKRLDACLIALAWCYGKFEDEMTERFAFKALRELLSTLLETIRTFHNLKGAAEKQARIAHSAKIQKAAERRVKLWHCIVAEAEVQNKTLSKGIKFARQIRPGVRQRLGLEPEGRDWPSASSIKVAISIFRAGEAKTSRTGLT